MENRGYHADVKLQAVKKVDQGAGTGAEPNSGHHDPNEIVVENLDPALKSNLTVKYVEKSSANSNRCCMVLSLALTLSLAVMAGALCNYFFLHQEPPVAAPTPCPTLAVETQDAVARVRSADRSLERVHMKPDPEIPIPVAIRDPKPKPDPISISNICLTKNCVQAAGRIIGNMDETVDPCQDFYEYSCGGWVKNNPIPADKSRYGILDQILDRNVLMLKTIMEKSPDSVHSRAEKQSLELYRACMDTDRRDELGVAPIVDIISSLGGWNPLTTDITETVTTLVKEYTAQPLFNINVGVDDYNSSINRLMIDQPAMVLPDRSFYFFNESHPVIESYFEFMRIVLVELGIEEPLLSELVTSIYSFEIELAKIVAPISERQDILSIYNKVTVAELQLMSPQLDWLSILRTTASPYDVKNDEEILLYSAEYIKSLSDLIASSDPRIIHNYMMWHIAASVLQVTSTKMKDAHNKVYNTLTGATRGPDPWKECAAIVSNRFDMAVGAMFVRDAFGPTGKQEVSEIVTHIKNAFKEAVLDNGWMSEETRHVAIEKVDAMGEKVAYPDYILDPVQLDKKFEGVVVNQTSFMQSMLNVSRFGLKQALEKLTKNVDKHEWLAPPQVLNALYRPSTNTMIMLAAILQPPIFDSANLWALNYAGIGYVVAHELTHGFDTHGRLYNKDGNIAPWWSEESARNFEDRTRCVVEQYSNYEVAGTNMKINGNLTKGENIADLGAIKHSFNAYKTLVMEAGEEPVLPGLEITNEQLFFLSFAQNWCTSRRLESSKLQLITDSHSPARFRVIGTLSQYDEFAEAFSCPVGSPMNPEHKCSVF